MGAKVKTSQPAFNPRYRILPKSPREPQKDEKKPGPELGAEVGEHHRRGVVEVGIREGSRGWEPLAALVHTSRLVELARIVGESVATDAVTLAEAEFSVDVRHAPLDPSALDAASSLHMDVMSRAQNVITVARDRAARAAEKGWVERGRGRDATSQRASGRVSPREEEEIARGVRLAGEEVGGRPGDGVRGSVAEHSTHQS